MTKSVTIVAGATLMACVGCVFPGLKAGKPETNLGFRGVERIESVPMGPIKGELVFTDLRKPGERSISGVVLRQRARERGASLSDGYALFLLQHPNLIPPQARGHQIAFPGTIYRDRSGIIGIPYIAWVDGRWVATLGRLNNRWPAGTLVLQLKETSDGGGATNSAPPLQSQAPPVRP